MKYSKRELINSVYILAFILILISLNGCSNRDQLEAARLEKKEEAVPVKVEKVVLKDMEKTLEYVGNIKAMDEAQVYPKVSGKIIEKIKEEGSQVNKGDVIAYIDRDEVGFTFEKAPVESPLTGVVGRMYVDIGTSVGVGTPIALVIDTKQMIIELSIPERYLPEVSVGERARITVDAFPGDEFSGKITKVSPVLDLETRSAPIEVTIENTEAKLQSGMFARVNLVIDEKKDAVVVIKEAILGSADKTYCFIAEDNKAVLRTIKTGLRQGSFVEVVEGLKAGNLVVIMGQQKLNDGTPVVVEED